MFKCRKVVKGEVPELCWEDLKVIEIMLRSKRNEVTEHFLNANWEEKQYIGRVLAALNSTIPKIEKLLRIKEEKNECM